MKNADTLLSWQKILTLVEYEVSKLQVWVCLHVFTCVDGVDRSKSACDTLLSNLGGGKCKDIDIRNLNNHMF